MVFGFGKSKRTSISEQAILDALRQVQDPDLHKNIVELGFVKNLIIDGSSIAFDVELTTPACPVKEQLKQQCEQVLIPLGASKVKVNMTARVRQNSSGKRPVPGVSNLLAVASGKGGVGKSTVALNLALALSRTGARVGLLDCDIYGPSLATQVGFLAQPKVLPDRRMLPHEVLGLKLMSMGFLLKPGQAASMRGPMVHKLIQQFLFGVAWEELDYLVLDLPPGTGDVQLSLTGETPLSGALIVTTPQEVALLDARRGVEMFQQAKVPVIGFIENMSYYLCRKCDKKHAIFSGGGGQRLANEYRLPLLAQLPLDPRLGEGCETGLPFLARESKGPTVQAFLELAGASAAALSKLSIQANGESGGWAQPVPGAMEV